MAIRALQLRHYATFTYKEEPVQIVLGTNSLRIKTKSDTRGWELRFICFMEMKCRVKFSKFDLTYTTGD